MKYAFPQSVSLTGLVIVLAVATAYSADPASEKAAKVKAAFVLNFIKLTTWPETAFKDAQSPIVITMVGDEELNKAMDDSIVAARIQGRSLVLHRLILPTHETYRSEDDYQQAWEIAVQTLRTSQVALFCEQTSQTRSAIARINSRTTLTVGDGAELLGSGAMLCLAEEQGHIVFYADSQSIKQSDLTLSSRLLRLARNK